MISKPSRLSSRLPSGLLSLAAALVVVMGISIATPKTASAQLTGTLDFEIDIESSYFDDCDPGTVCLVVFCGVFDGGLTLEYTGFDGTYDNYDVVANFDMRINLCPASPLDPIVTYLGEGTFQITRDTMPQQQMILDIVRPTGPPITINSGLVVSDTPFPAFDSFLLTSFPTSETFRISASLVTPIDPEFIRGDVNGDANLDIADAVSTLAGLFDPTSPKFSCEKATDSNDDGAIDISDAIFTLAALFTAGAPSPSAPFPDCGVDPSMDSLSCDAFDLCLD